MKNNRIQILVAKRTIHQQIRFVSVVILMLIALLFCISKVQGQAKWPQTAYSKDSTLISYEVYGQGEPTLVLVHGWSCDSRYWRNQIPLLAQNHKVVLVDMAGHGHSGVSRETYTMKAFGEDVQAVVDATESENVILIGHSMGGVIIAEAARLMPERVIALIGVDTYNNIEYPLTQEGYGQMTAPLVADFRSGTRDFVNQMLIEKENNEWNEWIKDDMSSAPPTIALSAMDEYMNLFLTGKMAIIYEDIKIPIMAVQGDRWPTDLEANRRHMSSFDEIVVEEADHFLMINKAHEFNQALKQAIQAVSEKREKQ